MVSTSIIAQLGSVSHVRKCKSNRLSIMPDDIHYTLGVKYKFLMILPPQK